MITKIVYLGFTTPIHFGRDKGRPDLSETAFTCHSDTFFSALAIEWLRLFGPPKLETLFESVRNGELLISDSLPYKGGRCYLPKPQKMFHKPKPDQIKAMKKLDFIGVKDFTDYCTLGINPVKELFAETVYNVRINKRDTEQPQPYNIASVRFLENCGLYFVLQGTDEIIKSIMRVIESLEETGIGGKRSSGFGKFQVLRQINLDDEASLTGDEKILKDLLEKKYPLVMNLSVILPVESEINRLKNENSAYQLINRSGFTADLGTKHYQVAMVNTGSCFPEKLKGQMINVALPGEHPVYRFGYGLFIGVPYE